MNLFAFMFNSYSIEVINLLPRSILPNPFFSLSSISINPKQMRHFTTTKDRFPEVRNKVLIGIISVYGIVAFVILYMFTSSKTEPDYTLVYTLTIIAPVLAFSTYRTIKRQKKMFETYLLTITDDTVIREQDNTPTITIAKDRIKKIIRTSAGIYCVIGESQLNAIAIPAQIEDRDDLEQLLSGIMPITAKTSGNALQWFYLAIGMLAVAAAFMGLASEDRIVSTLSALVICGVMLWGFVVIHRSKNVDRRMKRTSYIMIIPIMAMVANVILQWMNG